MSRFRFRWEQVLERRRRDREGRRSEYERDSQALAEAKRRRRELLAARQDGSPESPEDSLAALKTLNAWRTRAARADARHGGAIEEAARRADMSGERLRSAARQHETLARLRSRLHERHKRDQERRLERERDRRAAWEAVDGSIHRTMRT